MKLEFKHLLTLEERLSVFEIYLQLNPKLTYTLFTKRMTNLMDTNYQLLAVYQGQTLVAISGYWINYRLYCGKYLEPDNVVVHCDYRSQSIGEQLQSELERIAILNDCEVMMLDAYKDNHRGHAFYERHGYKAKGFHFIKSLAATAE